MLEILIYLLAVQVAFAFGYMFRSLMENMDKNLQDDVETKTKVEIGI